MKPTMLLRHLWREWIRPLALPVLLITAAKSALADINFVPSGSMEPTILPGEVVLINKLAYDLRIPFTWERLARWGNPARGDVVVCFAPDDGTRLVKRVVGLPGDILELRHETVWVNGRPLAYQAAPRELSRLLPESERPGALFATETLGNHQHAVMVLPARGALRDFGPLQIPPDAYFVMGDNRDNSRDSRYFGFVPRREIIGAVGAVALSFDPGHWLRPRFGRFGQRIE